MKNSIDPFRQSGIQRPRRLIVLSLTKPGGREYLPWTKQGGRKYFNGFGRDSRRWLPLPILRADAVRLAAGMFEVACVMPLFILQDAAVRREILSCFTEC